MFLKKDEECVCKSMESDCYSFIYMAKNLGRGCIISKL